MRTSLALALLAAAAASVAAGDPAAGLRPWPKEGGNPAVVFFVASRADDSEFGTNTAFHVGGGLFVTCVHAFDTYEKFGILTASGARARVDRIAAFDRATDVAVFTVDPPPEGIPALALSDRVPAAGEGTTLVGFPGNSYLEKPLPVLGSWTVAGWGDLVVLDGIAGAGSSGGPVLDGKDAVLGVLFRSGFGDGAGHEVGSLTHAASSRGIARLVEAGRAALGSGPGAPTIEEWVRTGRDDGISLPGIVHRALWTKDFAAAENAVRKRLAAHPKEARAWALYAEILRARGDLDSGAKAVDSALEADPRNCRALFELGALKERLEETASAIAAYGECARARLPGMDFNDLVLVSDAHCKRAFLLDRAGRREEAVQAYRDALAVSPYLSCEQWRLGDLLCILDRPREAIASYRRSLDIRSRQPLVVLRLAVAESSAGDGMAALADARRAVAMDGESAPARFLLGYLAWREGRTEEASAQVAPLGDRDPALAERLAAHLAGSEKRGPSFEYSTGGGLRVHPLPPR